MVDSDKGISQFITNKWHQGPCYKIFSQYVKFCSGTPQGPGPQIVWSLFRTHTATCPHSNWGTVYQWFRIAGTRKPQSPSPPTLFLVWADRVLISPVFRSLPFPNQHHTHTQTPPDVYSLLCEYYIEAVIIINARDHPKSGGVSLTASLYSIPYVPESKRKRRKKKKKKGETVRGQMHALTRDVAHFLPGDWSAIPFCFDNSFSLQEQNLQSQKLPG